MLRNLADDIVGTIVSSIGTMISIGLNLTPILLFYRYFKKTAPLETIPESMFITGIFCCATNLAYGILKGDKILIISNGVCYGLQILYGTTFIFIKNAKRIDKLLLYLIIAWDLSFEVLYIFADVLAFHTSNDFAQTFTGGFNIFIGTLNVITPGQNIIKVFKTGDFTLIPIVTIFFQCACSSLWFVYGLTDLDPNMIVPNLLGTVITTIQITTFYYFYCKLHGIPPERKEDDEQSPEQQKDGTTEQIGNTNDQPDNEQKLMADD
jgi:hypothetical protein